MNCTTPTASRHADLGAHDGFACLRHTRLDHPHIQSTCHGRGQRLRPGCSYAWFKTSVSVQSICIHRTVPFGKARHHIAVHQPTFHAHPVLRPDLRLDAAPRTCPCSGTHPDGSDELDTVLRPHDGTVGATVESGYCFTLDAMAAWRRHAGNALSGS